MLPAIAFPAIDPVAIAVGPFAVRWYALAYIAGIMIGWRYCLWLARRRPVFFARSEEHTSELQSLMRISYAVFCLKKKQYTIPFTRNASYIQRKTLIDIEQHHNPTYIPRAS